MDLRKQQTALLRIERTLENIATDFAVKKKVNVSKLSALSAAIMASIAAAPTALSHIVERHQGELFAALSVIPASPVAGIERLAAALTVAHAEIEAHAVSIGAVLLRADGVPKRPPLEAVLSILSLG